MSEVVITTIGESCQFFNGKAHEKDIDVDGKYIVVNSKFISQEGRVIKKTKDQMFRLYKGDIVMVMSDVPNGKALAKCFIIDKDETYSLNQRICCIRSKVFDTKYLYYQLNRNEHFLAFNNGENQTNLRKDDILNCTLIKPSMEEQKRIVTKLESTLFSLDQAKAHAEQNLKNAKELFESYLQGVFENKGDGWEEKSLGEITTKIGSGATPRGGKNSYKDKGISLIRSMNVHDRSFKFKDLAFIDDKQAGLLNNVTVNQGDVLLNITGASVARCAVVPTEILPARVNQHVSIIRPIQKIVESKFLNFLLTAKPIKDELLYIGSKGATRQAITKTEIENFTVHIPDLKEQLEIIKKIERIQTETQKLETLYQKKIAALDELKKSILQKAMAGELVESQGEMRSGVLVESETEKAIGI
jgi:type I restriction enzyme, S subunit